jgi:hypothetical protein
MEGGAAGRNQEGRRQRAEVGIRAAFGWSEFAHPSKVRRDLATVKFAAGRKSLENS